MLKVNGAMFLAPGLAAGVALVLSPFGLLSSARPSLAAWLLFPANFVAGSVLLALAAPSALPGVPGAVTLVRPRARRGARNRARSGSGILVDHVVSLFGRASERGDPLAG